MKNFRLYIGGDNETGKVNRSHIKKILLSFHQGFTIHPTGDGYWKDEEGKEYHEKSVMVEVTAPDIDETIETLKRELKQKEIGVVEDLPISFR